MQICFLTTTRRNMQMNKADQAISEMVVLIKSIKYQRNYQGEEHA